MPFLGFGAFKWVTILDFLPLSRVRVWEPWRHTPVLNWTKLNASLALRQRADFFKANISANEISLPQGQSYTELYRAIQLWPWGRLISLAEILALNKSALCRSASLAFSFVQFGDKNCKQSPNHGAWWQRSAKRCLTWRDWKTSVFLVATQRGKKWFSSTFRLVLLAFFRKTKKINLRRIPKKNSL